MDLSWEYVLTHHRWIFVCCFLLPLSVLYDLFNFVRNWVVFSLVSAPLHHSKKVQQVQAQVREWQEEGGARKMCTGRPGWQTISFRQPKYKDTHFKVKVDLVDILHVDVVNKIVDAEPLVTMGQLTATLEPLGWTLPVLPELDDLTVGGLIMGTGVETSSHKYGLFQHICESFELVMPDGEVIECSKEDNSDLYYSVPWSYGTVGFLTSVKIRIVPAFRFVKLEYIPVQSLDEAVSTFTEKTASNADFVEGLMFNSNQAVIMVGNMVHSAEPGRVNRVGRWYKPWFFKHAEGYLSKGLGGVEYIPLRDYYHRHSRSIFWEIQEIIPFGNHPVFRYLFGWMAPPKVSLLKITQPAAVKKLYEQKHMIQDMLLPISTLKPAITLFDQETGIYPLWLCPFKLEHIPGMVHPPSEKSEQMYVDIGAYGVPKRSQFHPEKTTRRIEEFVRESHGFQMLYADTYMTREEFRTMFDHSLYDIVRTKYKCTKAFPEAYDKVNRDARH